MKHLLKLNFQIMGRSVWVETLETDQDPKFIKLKAEAALSILLKTFQSLPHIEAVDVTPSDDSSVIMNGQ